MKRLIIVALGTWICGASIAEAHAFLDHAEPKVGSTIVSSPSTVKIWFTDGLLASSKIEVFDSKGRAIDKADVKIDPADKSSMAVSMPKLPAGEYKVVWNAYCPLGHHTTGSFTFEVKSP